MADELASRSDAPEGDPDLGGQVDAAAFMKLSESLRIAFARLGETRLSPEDAARWQRRLIAITTVAKRDLAKALDNMERFEADWAKRRTSR